MRAKACTLLGGGAALVPVAAAWMLSAIALGSESEGSEEGTHTLASLDSVVLARPRLDGWAPGPAAEPAPASAERYPLFVQARYHDATVYVAKNPKWGRGLIRYGHAVRARWLGTREGCAGGHWYELAQGGYVCTARGFSAREERPSLPEDAKAPRLDAPLPYRYARVLRDGALRYERALSTEEIAALPDNWDADHAPEHVVDRMVGDYFVALAERERATDGSEYFRTVRGHYVPSEDLKLLTTPGMRGVELDDTRLPVAFVFGADHVPVFRLEDGEADRALERVGLAEKHARAQIRRRVEIEGAGFWVTRRGLALPAEHVRVARAHARPDDIGAHERWLHIDLSQQTLVAYEGDTPVYATLISSGKPGHDTAAGSYRVRHKYVSITMRGDDPKDGPYEVEEVPWTQYYDANFAVHGAYWHDDFGNVRSHGCTNLAPADARWLYDFTDPRVPTRWHGVRREGTRVEITG